MKSVRVASVQFAAAQWANECAFLDHISHYVRIAADYQAQAIVFPELFTLPLATIDGPCNDVSTLVARLSAFAPRLDIHVQQLAQEHRMVIVAGSTLKRRSNGQVCNTATIALPDGVVCYQDKLHPTPDERRLWGVEGGDRLQAIQTPFGPIGVLVCYDCEFPELGRKLADEGIDFLFVPYLADTRHGHLRVRLCAHARAIENQIYLVLAGGAGLMQGVPGQDTQYASSSILTPIDLPFARDGVAAQAPNSGEHIIFADLDLDALHKARAEGFVRNRDDRRADLYQTHWTGQ